MPLKCVFSKYYLLSLDRTQEQNEKCKQMTWVCEVRVWIGSSSSSFLTGVSHLWKTHRLSHDSLWPCPLSSLNSSPSAQSRRNNQRILSHHFIALWLWENDLTFLSLSFLYWKMGVSRASLLGLSWGGWKELMQIGHWASSWHKPYS